jgi:DNA-3-methyladenine glycosylase II
MQFAVRARREAKDSRAHLLAAFRVVVAIGRLLRCRATPDKFLESRMFRISTARDVESALDALCSADRRLQAVRQRAGPIPLRLSPPGFESLASIIVSQQVSRASADAIMQRLTRLVDPLTPAALLGAGDGIFREAGLSRPKQRAVVAAAAAARDGLDLVSLCSLDAADAVARMTAVPGIGPWTAQCYLLFAAGHPDIFPAGDVALQTAVGRALAVDPRPGERQLASIAESWSPFRSSAARLFWAYYREIRGKEAAPTPKIVEKSMDS